MLFGVRLGVWGGAVWGALRVTVQAHFCEIDGRVMQFGVLLQVLFWDAVWGAVGGASDGAGARLTAGCCLGRSSGGAVGGAGVESLLSGVYAGVVSFFWVGGVGGGPLCSPLARLNMIFFAGVLIPAKWRVPGHLICVQVLRVVGPSMFLCACVRVQGLP